MKRRLLGLPQENLVREVDFCPLSGIISGDRDLWLGVVVGHQDGSILAQKILGHAPTVNDLANLLADAMRRPLTDEDHCRPKSIQLRDNPEWQELYPHLEQLGIQVVITEELQAWDETVGELTNYLASGQWKEPEDAAWEEDEEGLPDELAMLRLAAILFPPRRQLGKNG